MKERFCLLCGCWLAFLFPARPIQSALFFFGVGLVLRKTKASLSRLIRLRPDTFTLSALAVLLSAGVLTASSCIPLSVGPTVTGVLFLLTLQGPAVVREREGIFVSLSLAAAGCAGLGAVCLSSRLSDGAAAFFCVLVTAAAWENKNSLPEQTACIGYLTR